MSDNYIITYSGVKFDLLNPKPEMVLIKDIAHALSNICRFTGHTQQFYSVAQHSVECSRLVTSSGYRLESLLHDAHEAYIGDVATPLKRLLPDYQKVEERVASVVRTRFGLPEETSTIVKDVDLRALGLEKRIALRCSSLEDRWDCLQSTPITNGFLHLWTPEEAEKRFLEWFYELAD